MITKFNLQTDIETISNALFKCPIGMNKLIYQTTDINSINFKELKFRSKTFIPDEILKGTITMTEIILYGIRYFDVLIYENLPDDKKEKVIWSVDGGIPDFNVSDIAKGIIYVWFMVLTRNKVYLDDNEKCPAMLKRYSIDNQSVNLFKAILSSNDLNRFEHKWIANVDLRKVSPQIQSRIKKGACGTRILNVFRNFEPQNLGEGKYKNLYLKLKSLAVNGPYWDLHTLFMPLDLSATSFNTILKNLIMVLYDEETIKKMVKTRALYAIPIANPAVSIDTLTIAMLDKIKYPFFPKNKGETVKIFDDKTGKEKDLTLKNDQKFYGDSIDFANLASGITEIVEIADEDVPVVPVLGDQDVGGGFSGIGDVQD